MTAGDLAETARRHAVILAVIVAGAMAIAVARDATAPRETLATAKLLYIDQRSLDAGETRTGTGQDDGASVTDLLNSEREMLATPSLAIDLARALGPAAIAPNLKPGAGDAEIAAAVLGRLSVEPVAQSHVLELGFHAADPAVATGALGYLIRRHLERHLAMFGSDDHGQAPARARLDAILAEEAAYRSTHDTFDPQGQRQALLKSRTGLTEEGFKLRGQIADAQARLDDLKDQFTRAPVRIETPTVESSPESDDALAAARAKLRDLHDQQRALSAQDGAAARTLQDQIDALSGFIHAHETAGGQVRPFHGRTRDDIGEEMAQTQTELRPLQARLATVEAQLGEIAAQLKGVEEASLRIAEFESARAEAEAGLKAAANRPAATTNSAERNRLEPHVIQEPVVVGETRGIGAWCAGGIGLAIGLTADAFLLLALAFTRRTCDLPGSLERRYGMPVLTSLPIRYTAR